MKILLYESEKVFKRKKLVEQLKKLTNDGDLDSPMQRFLDSKKKGFIIIAWKKGVPIGWCSLFHCSKKYFVVDIFVAEQHRNQKIATRILNKVSDKKLLARPWDEAGKKLYSKFPNIER